MSFYKKLLIFYIIALIILIILGINGGFDTRSVISILIVLFAAIRTYLIIKNGK